MLPPCLFLNKSAKWIKMGCSPSLHLHKPVKRAFFPRTNGKGSVRDRYPQAFPERHTQDSLQKFVHCRNTDGPCLVDD